MPDARTRAPGFGCCSSRRARRSGGAGSTGYATRHPRARVYFHSAAADPAPLRAAEAVFGRRVVPQYDFRRATVVVAVGADFLATGPGHLRHARDFADGRRVASPDATMNRLYVAEAAPTPTGTTADHRLRARPSELPALLRRAAERGRRGARRRRCALRRGARAGSRPPPPICARRAAPASCSPASASRPRVTPRAAVLNAVLRNEGATVWYIDPPVLEAGEPTHDLAALAREIEAGAVDTLIVAGGNPVYAAPGDLDLAARLGAVRTTLYLGAARRRDRARVRVVRARRSTTSRRGSDARACDGTVSLGAAADRAALRRARRRSSCSPASPAPATRRARLVREHWRARLGGAGPEAERAWEEALQRGVIPGTAAPRAPVAADARALERFATRPARRRRRRIEVAFRPDPPRPRRPLREQRVAPGAARSDHQAHLGATPRCCSPRTAARLGVARGGRRRGRRRRPRRCASRRSSCPATPTTR